MIPPAVVEAMARAIAETLGYRWDLIPEAYDGGAKNVLPTMKAFLAAPEAALSAALASGEIIQVTPIEKALMEDFRDLGSKDAGKMARLMELLPRYRAFIAGRVPT